MSFLSVRPANRVRNLYVNGFLDNSGNVLLRSGNVIIGNLDYPGFNINQTSLIVNGGTVFNGNININGNLSSSTQTIALGYLAGSTNQAANTIAIGANTVVSGLNNIAIGAGAITGINGNSISIGANSSTDVWGNSIVIGTTTKVNSNVHVGTFLPQVTNVLNSWSDIAFGTPTTGGYANKGLFVAVSYDGSYNRVMNSPDAVNWYSQSTFNFDNSWNGLIFGTTSAVGTYASGTPIFVSIATTSIAGNLVMISADGNTWSNNMDGVNINNKWSCITYGNTSSVGSTYGTIGTPIFVSIANSGTNRVMTSQNGNTWIQQTLTGLLHNWQSVTYGNGTFAAVADSSNNCVMTSTNGSTWTNRSTVGFDNSWNSVIYGIPSTGLYAGQGVFVAVAYSGNSNRVMTSWDGAGAIWNPISVPVDTWYSVAYGQGTFMAVSYSGNAMTSTDTINWSLVTTPAKNPWRSVTYGIPSIGQYAGKGVFASVASYGTNRVMTSSFGDSLITSAVAIGNGAYANGDNTMALGQGARVNGSTLGTFVQRTASVAGAWTSITDGIVTATGQLIFVAVSTTAGTSNDIMTSYDGITWIPQTSPVDLQWTSVTYGIPSTGIYANIGLFVAVAQSGTGNRIMTSPDGINWIIRTSPADYNWINITYGIPSSGIFAGQGVFVAVASSGSNNIMYSVNGILWTLSTTTITVSLLSVTYGTPSSGLYQGQGMFVALPNISTTTSYISKDGINWISTLVPLINTTWYSVTYGIPSTGIYAGQGLFIAGDLSNGSQFMRSTDLSGWTVTDLSGQITPNGKVIQTFPVRSITYGNGTFVAVGQSNTGAGGIVYSTDGINWISQQPPANNNWYSIAYGTPSTGIYTGQGIFVAVASNASSAATTVMTANFADVYKTNSTAIGNGALTTGNNSLTIGNNSMTLGDNSLAYGYNASVTGNNSVALGTSAKVNSPYHLGDFKAYTSPIAARVIFGVAYGNGLFVAPIYSSLLPNKVLTSPDGITWTIRQAGQVGQAGGNNTWINATFGITSTASSIYPIGTGLFVVVGDGGTNRLMTSPDGINWTLRASSGVLDGNSWYGLTYGNGYFVAGSATGTVFAYSQNGIDWTLVSGISSNSWYGLTYGNGIYIAVSITTGSTTNRIYRSTNATTWTGYSVPVDNQWTDVAYGNGTFVAIASTGTGNRAMTSPDGINWTLRSTPVESTNARISFGNGLFLVSMIGSSFMTSPDGINWSIKPVPYYTSWRAIGYGLVNGIGTFVTVNDVDMATTAQAIIATPNVLVASFADTNTLNSVAIGQSAFANGGNAIAIGNSAKVSGQQLSNFVPRASANDAYQWNAITNGVPSQGPYQGQNLFVAVATTLGSTTNRIMTSVDTINWTGRNIPSTADKSWTGMVYGIPSQGIYAGQGLFVCISNTSTSNGVLTSPDGINWIFQALSGTNSTNQWREITYGNGMFVACAQAGTYRFMWSRDGYSWTAITATTQDYGTWSGLTYGNGLFVASTYSAASTTPIVTSSDGITWTDRTATIGPYWASVTYGIPLTGQYAGTGLFVASGLNSSSTAIMTSPDGITWTVRSTPTTSYLLNIKYGNGYFVAVSVGSGGGGLPLISTDGINWTIKQNTVANAWYLTYGIPSSGPYTGQGMFVTVGTPGTGTACVATANFIDTYTTNSIAIGNGAIANGNNSVAIGNGAYSFSDNQITLGTPMNNETVRLNTITPMYKTPIFTAGMIGYMLSYNIPSGSLSGYVSLPLTPTAGVWCCTANIEFTTAQNSTSYIEFNIGGTRRAIAMVDAYVGTTYSYPTTITTMYQFNGSTACDLKINFTVAGTLNTTNSNFFLTRIA